MVRCLSKNANSGIYVSESLSSGQAIPVRRDTVVAFLGSAPRGPVGIPVTIGSVDEYLKRFGAHGCISLLFDTIRQFFMNGGKSALVVRVCSSVRHHRIVLPTASETLTLDAINPGSHELLRASIDYDGIPSTDSDRFNLVVHRLMSRDRPIVEQQEVYRGLTVDIADAHYVGHALLESELVRVSGRIPGQRPQVTFHSGIDVGSSYIYVDPDWSETECLNDYDLIGCKTEGTGLFALDQVPSIDLVNLVPDTSELGPVALFTAERYCRERNALLLVDPPEHWRTVRDAVRSARESGFASPNVATYFPRPSVAGEQPASALGAFSGALAARDAQDVTWGLTGNELLDIRGCDRLPFDIDCEEQYAIHRAGINVLRRAGPSRLELTGLVTLNRGSGCISEWDQLQWRRTTLFIVDSIARGTRWAAFQGDDPGTPAELYDQVRQYLHDLFAIGVLSGASVDQPGYVTCERTADDAHQRGRNFPDCEAGIVFDVGFTLSGNGLQSFRFHQCPDECRIRRLHTEHPVAMAS